MPSAKSLSRERRAAEARQLFILADPQELPIKTSNSTPRRITRDAIGFYGDGRYSVSRESFDFGSTPAEIGQR